MQYSKIKEILSTNQVDLVDAEVAIAVNMAQPCQITDEEFDLLCKYVSSCLKDVVIGYTQLMADIVVDMYCDCDYGYRNDDDFLTIEDLKNPYGAKREIVVNKFCLSY